MNKPRLLIMAGGTGGHVFPGLAVAEYMKTLRWDVHWMGTPDKMEANLVPKYGYPIHFVNIGGVRGKSIITKILTPFRLLSAVFQAIRILRACRPDVALGMGGFASGPGGIAAKMLKIPLVVHEQNAVFGMTNRYLSKIANAVMTGFDLSQNVAKSKAPQNTIFVGNPIRDGFFEIREKAIETKQIQNTPNSLNILIVGGSLGALALNQQVPPVLIELANRFELHVRHQAGKGKATQVIDAYNKLEHAQVTEFIDDMEASFAWADIIICRAGALTVAEVAGAGRVAIFVPLPIAVDDHQRENARYLSEQDAAVLIDQNDLEQKLAPCLQALFESPIKRHEMARRAKQLGMKDATKAAAAILQKQIKTDVTEANKERA